METRRRGKEPARRASAPRGGRGDAQHVEGPADHRGGGGGLAEGRGCHRALAEGVLQGGLRHRKARVAGAHPEVRRPDAPLQVRHSLRAMRLRLQPPAAARGAPAAGGARAGRRAPPGRGGGALGAAAAAELGDEDREGAVGRRGRPARAVGSRQPGDSHPRGVRGDGAPGHRALGRRPRPLARHGHLGASPAPASVPDILPDGEDGLVAPPPRRRRGLWCPGEHPRGGAHRAGAGAGPRHAGAVLRPHVGASGRRPHPRPPPRHVRPLQADHTGRLRRHGNGAPASPVSAGVRTEA
mmetsp:Transcript_48486/g.134909  ORF Transcript_48486/g.134909 Transcript_48486/m.134909 type:complete len:297 (-) Transcript_48486:53-943(-)